MTGCCAFAFAAFAWGSGGPNMQLFTQRSFDILWRAPRLDSTDKQPKHISCLLHLTYSNRLSSDSESTGRLGGTEHLQYMGSSQDLKPHCAMKSHLTVIFLGKTPHFERPMSCCWLCNPEYNTTTWLVVLGVIRMIKILHTHYSYCLLYSGHKVWKQLFFS